MLLHIAFLTADRPANPEIFWLFALTWKTATAQFVLPTEKLLAAAAMPAAQAGASFSLPASAKRNELWTRGLPDC
jgi:hypothetical protein